jgi:hypothetical protein
MSQAAFTAQAAARLVGQGVPAASIATALQEEIFSGVYLNINSSAVHIVFFAVSIGFLLWLRGHLGPGPQIFAIIFSCILQCA